MSKPKPATTAVESSSLGVPLPDDLVLEILVWLSPIELLRNVQYTSTRFHALLNDKQFWYARIEDQRKIQQKRQPPRYHPACSLYRIPENDEHATDSKTVVNGDGNNNQEVPSLSLRQLQRVCVFSHVRFLPDVSVADEIVPPQLRPKSILPTKEVADSMFPDGRVCLASSTDHSQEQIENVLPNSDNSTADNETHGTNNDDNSRNSGSAGWFSAAWPHPNNNNIGLGGINIETANQDDDERTAAFLQFHVRQFYMRRPSYWSSAENPKNQNGDADDMLLFTTSTPLAIVSDIAIKPFTEEDVFAGYRQTYTWRGVTVRVYHIPPSSSDQATRPFNFVSQPGGSCYMSKPSLSSTALSSAQRGYNDDKTAKDQGNDIAAFLASSNAPQQQLIQYILDSYEPTYESSVLPTPPPENDEWQRHTLPPGIVGNVIILTLVGKNFKQFPSSGYYACVEEVAARGAPVGD